MENGLLQDGAPIGDEPRPSEFRGSVDDARRASYGPRVARPLWLRLLFLLCACSGCFGVYYG